MPLAFPIVFAELPTGLSPMSLFDQAFALIRTGAYFADQSIPESALALSGVVAGIYGDGANVPRLTVNSKGFITEVTLVPISGLAGSTVFITTAAPLVVGAGDSTVIVNKAAASDTSILLPAVATRNGLPLRISDFTGKGQNITVTPNGAETIMANATFVLASGGPGLGSDVTLYPSTTLNGWYVA